MSSHHHGHDHGQDHAPRIMERHCDAAVIGGSAAGLAAALQLGRQRRSVIVVDSGEPRNAPAAHMHSYLGYDGRPPADLTSTGRDEVRRYGVEVLPGRAVATTRHDLGFRVELTGGHAVVARRLLVATGLVDELPSVDGIADHWGRDVLHCPFCHGYEVRDRRVVQIVTHPMNLHPTPLFRQLTDRLTVVISDAVEADPHTLGELRRAGVELVVGSVRRIIEDRSGGISAVELADGTRIDADAVAVGPRFRPRLDPFAPLGLAATPHPSGLGDHVPVEPTGATAVPGVYAAGNVTDPSQQVLAAAAQGSWVGGMIAFDLAHDDVRTASRRSGNEADWDHRYSGEQMWSGNPNGTLVNEVAGATPGRALDVGAGEGGDAVWLAEQGWAVTANDVSQRALDRVAAEADRRDLTVTCLHADANAPGAFPPAAFDLVSAQYASIPRTADDRGIANLLAAVAPGGLLLVVGHDLEPMRRPIDPSTQSRAFDPDAYVRVGDVARAVAANDGWAIELHETRPRPPGAASGHHVDDEVLRARRT